MTINIDDIVIFLHKVFIANSYSKIISNITIFISLVVIHILVAFFKYAETCALLLSISFVIIVYLIYYNIKQSANSNFEAGKHNGIIIKEHSVRTISLPILIFYIFLLVVMLFLLLFANYAYSNVYLSNVILNFIFGIAISVIYFTFMKLYMLFFSNSMTKINRHCGFVTCLPTLDDIRSPNYNKEESFLNRCIYINMTTK